MLQLKELSLLESKEGLKTIPPGKVLINTINAHSYNTAQKDERFAEALKKGDYLIPDGASIVKACHWLGCKSQPKERIAGWDLFEFEMDRLNQKGGTCFFLGASEKTLQLIKEKARLLMREYELTCDINSPGDAGAAKVNVKYTLGQRLDLGCAELQLRTEPSTPIQGAVVESKTTSGGQFVVFETNEPEGPEQRILMNIPDDTTGEMKVDVFVSGNSYAFRCKHQKFFGFQLVNNAKAIGSVEFTTSGQMFLKFVTTCFVVGEVKSASFKLCFQSLEKHEPLVLWSNGTKCKIE